MKSIVQEGSSIVKAIDCAWRRAEEPTEFSVRIHEHPQKNMFGFTTKSAKIALFYQEERKKERPARQSQKQRPKKSVEKIKNSERTGTKQAPVKEKKAVQKPQRRQENNEPWNENMIEFAKSWLNDLLGNLNVNHAKFELEPQRYHLKVTFTKPVFTEDDKNRILFRNCAHLLLQAARNNFKRPLKGFKVVLTTDS